MILFEGELEKLTEQCNELWRNALASGVFAVAPDGQLIAAIGRFEHLDTTALASLIAGSVAATNGLADIVGEGEFATHYHEGAREHLYIAKITEGLILAIAFDERSSLGLVRLRLKKAAVRFEEVYAQMVKKQEEAPLGLDIFGEISDEDIDSFFGDTFR